MIEDDKATSAQEEEFKRLLDEDTFKISQIGEIVKGTVVSASKAEVRLDIDGIACGVVRGQELYFEAEEYANLKPGDEVEATVIEEENENGELELSFKYAGQQKAWNILTDAFENKKIIKVKINDANKGGLIISYGQISGFLPVSQLSPENYPRVNGGDKSKILDKLKSFVGSEIEGRVMALDEKEEKLVISEKDAWQERQKDTISKYKIGSIVDGAITALTDFGVFVSFNQNLEGLIHISELAWQRIDSPADLFKVGDIVKAEIISIDGSKIFLSAKKLLKDPWHGVEEKYKIGQQVAGTVLKVNPFGLFVELDSDIHGLAHISQLGLTQNQKIDELFKAGDKKEFLVVSLEPRDHRLGLSTVKAKNIESKSLTEQGDQVILESSEKTTVKIDKKEPKIKKVVKEKVVKEEKDKKEKVVKEKKEKIVK
ncbi:S1 RNA-binding domain-containing protein [Patescibacteria group bacterium]|nr:S1 RNA-binding domain-containing protein [Patescibacteria group bacterium]MBU0879734.1 S1 RNA-binding domain-containing protein [Patescibacteria group bacterium]MBU0897941.1 S1 RNA-binding domain-containing protein [Patescibacteria group bacterium]MBU1062985.1 S1 RNA-binding domain-containing protein [Patescibacteria group bacterium]MBU1783703.1 S1 RNA-binding domain-containing protein [Patescibacteria group bacterium]